MKSSVIRTLFKRVVKTFFLVFYAFLKVLRPLVHMRLGLLTYGRIGHLGPETELYLRRRHRNGVPRREWHVFITGKPANRQLLSMIKRRVTVVENRWLARSWRTLRQSVEDPDFWIELPWHENEYEEFNHIPSQLAFTKAEEERGKKLLAGMGIPPGTPFVCFHARDKAYLDVAHSWQPRDKWAYHDHRDCDIRNYMDAAEYLTSLGLFALRMGYIVEGGLAKGNPKVIDYATLHRTDFGDVYLPAKCKFFLGSTAGLYTIAWMFDVPVACANWLPMEVAPPRRCDLFIPKKLWWRERKRFLTFREIFNSEVARYVRTEQYTEAGLEVIENTSEEILALAREMNDRLDGVWVEKEEDEELQRRYRDLIPPRFFCYGAPSRIGTDFLSRYRELVSPR
jgi:putative glycosyltransferase (TIGR04372 family)